MYEEYYGLSKKPFLTVPDPEFIYWSDAHRRALAVLRYAIMTRAPISVITGESGVGKTTMLRKLLAELPEKLTVGLITNVQTGRGELLHWIMMALDQPFDGTEHYVKLFKRFQDFAVDAHSRGRRVVLIIDEAQNLTAEWLEELRLLSNFNVDKSELLQIILVGKPELRDMLSAPHMAQFNQRVTSDYKIGPLSETGTARYIHRRLAIAGATEEIFPLETCSLIHKATNGLPRLINTLCDLCLVYGFSAEHKVISEDLLKEFLDSAKRHGVYTQFAALSDEPRRIARPTLREARLRRQDGTSGH